MSSRPPGDHEEWRFHYDRLLEEFGKYTGEFRIFRIEREKALREVEERLTMEIQTYWKASAAGLRQLSDWFAETEDRAQRERDAERARMWRRDKVLIGIGLIWIILLAMLVGLLIDLVILRGGL